MQKLPSDSGGSFFLNMTKKLCIYYLFQPMLDFIRDL